MLPRSRQGTFATVLGRTPEASLVATERTWARNSRPADHLAGRPSVLAMTTRLQFVEAWRRLTAGYRRTTSSPDALGRHPRAPRGVVPPRR
jgi:hypothetical protein